MYKFSSNHLYVIRLSDGHYIPADLSNIDYIAYLEDFATDPTCVVSADPVTPPPILSITPRQFRLALNATGMRANIEAYVAAGSQDMKDTWEFATTIERNDPIIAAGAAELDLTEAQIDDLFSLAATL